MYKIEFSKQGAKDANIVERAGLKNKAAKIIKTVRENPYNPKPPGHRFEKLSGYPRDTYSRRLSYHNRFVYEVLQNDENIIDPQSGKPYQGIVKIVSMWGHDYVSPA